MNIIEGAFETWRPVVAGSFDLVFAATAWHWIDPAIRYQRAWQLLRPGGHLAFWSATHVLPDGGDPFFVEIQDVYDEIGEGLPEAVAWPRPGELREDRAEIERSRLFDHVVVRHFDWEVSYNADEYLALLDTFLATSPWTHGSASTSTRRSGGASHNDRTVASVGTGEQSCKSRAEPSDLLCHKPNPLRTRRIAVAAIRGGGASSVPGPPG